MISLGAGNCADGVRTSSPRTYSICGRNTCRSTRIYTDLIPIMEDVITRYMDDVKTRNYPGPENTIKMPEDELRKFAKDMKWERKLDELG